ncbi:MAG: heme biosynthesis protein HemY [Methylibium sp. NZG]|nr:MAG: heme biosynthesis protein HemY [Methylibium sp. NZG]
MNAERSLPLPPSLPLLPQADLERRFGGLRRLYGDAGYARIRAAHVAVVGLGGVGSWACEALARSGVAALTLIDLDHVAESNINRQVQATGATVGQAKALALRDRVADIHPGCVVTAIEAFVDESNWPGLLTAPVDVLIDACDQVSAKAVLAAWALRTGTPLVTVGAAGGKRRPQEVRLNDLALVTHDPLLASLRQRLRQQHGGARSGAMGVRCVHSLEPVAPPQVDACAAEGSGTGATGGSRDSSLNCHGYGSSVGVTAAFGMVAANEALEFALRRLQVAPAKPI